MSKSPSKQLSSLLSRVPSATGGGKEDREPMRSVPYAPTVSPTSASERSDLPAEEPEVPLQVLVPESIRLQVDRMYAETRKSRRQIVLEALRANGFAVTDEQIAGKRGQKKAFKS